MTTCRTNRGGSAKLLHTSITRRSRNLSHLLRRSAAVTFLLFIGPPSVGLADTHYVSKNGTNTYPYDSWATAADTVARAVEAASEWDTILIGAGHFVSDTIMLKRGQSLIGAGMDSTILDTLPLNPWRPIYAEDSCTVSDLTLRGIGGLAAKAREDVATRPVAFESNAGIRVVDDRALRVVRVRFDSLTSGVSASFTNLSQTGRLVEIDSCEFKEFESAILGTVARLEVRDCHLRWDRDAVVGVIIADFSELTVENCRFYGSDPLTAENGAAAISTKRTEPIIIRNSLFYSSMEGPALDLNVQDGSSDSVRIGIVENNTFVKNLGHIWADRPGFVFRNNISMWDRSGITSDAFYSGCVRGEYNTTWDNSPWDSGLVRTKDTIPNDVAGNHDNRNVHPMFVDTVDFLLQAFSPAIDAGDPAILDRDGSRSDIGYAGGPGGFSHPYLDLAPAVPRGLTGAPSDSQIVLCWRGNHEADFDHHELFRDSLPISAPDSALRVADIYIDSTYIDTAVVTGSSYHYRVRALDRQDNASTLSDEAQFVATGVGDQSPPSLPEAFTLRQNYPNPFNAGTRISLTVYKAGLLTVVAFNAAGQTVDVLHSAPVQRGEVHVDWIPSHLSAGVYFLRIEMPFKTEILKVMYLK